jgi:hypothetical protein
MDQSHGGSASSVVPSSEATDSRVEWARSWPESAFVVAAFVIYLVFQLHAAAFHGYWGQDWVTHKIWINEATEHPWTFLTHYSQSHEFRAGGRTNPPLYHILCGLVKRTVGVPHYLLVIGLVNVALGFAGLCFAYGVIYRLIASPFVRAASIVFILFVPFAMVHAQVIASDALATPLFWFLLWLLVRVSSERSKWSLAVSLVFLPWLLMAATLVKFTFASFILATGIWAILLWWTRLWSARRSAVALVVVTVIPMLFAYLNMVRYGSQLNSTLGIAQPPALSEAAMNPRSVVWLRAADVDVLHAPAYNWKVNGKFDLLVENKHSFPALLHLAIFTDILNIYQFDPYDHYFGIRTLRNHHRMRTAVRSGILISIFTVVGVIALLARSTITVLFHRDPRDFLIFIVLLFSMAWFANIVVFLPFIRISYYGGCWHPRLLAPALLGFFIVGFTFLDRSRWMSRKLQIAVLVVVLTQSAVHASFMWPTRSSGRLYESDADIAASADTILRVFNWQDGPTSRVRKEHWLDRTIGIVVNRPHNAPQMENWRLSFTVSPGPSNPVPHRVIRISSRHLAPKLVEFDETRRIQLDVPLDAGRNDIVVNVVAPEQFVELPNDPFVRMVSISKIALQPSGARGAVSLRP